MSSPHMPGGPTVSPDEIMMRVRRELQEQQMEELVQTLADKCFSKCVHKPSSSLSSSEQHCIAKAMDRYLDVMSVVFRTLASKSEAQ